ncbi:acetyl-CoA hydrolase [Haloechinothrix alba]|uniref:Acetyl-CoA hydrolase n=1 Tax=Haloechinothrix alba TaxID=664784 RepID=A0A238ZHU2_9PSEU|nr:acetyl-CoA hydrolase/transferase C-terminal domain-containing protein [Haloechinothrix alba]SNR82739.1 acetyl-CoA hydrolase [Haloechinothrix alba]
MGATAVEELELARYVRPGDTVAWGQACAEPTSLTQLLMRQRADIGRFRCFLGIPVSDTVRPEHADHVSFVSYTASGSNRALYDAGTLDIVPCHYSVLPRLLCAGPLRADVALLQLAPTGRPGIYSLGAGDDYLSAAIDTARVVLAEVNEQAPCTAGSREVHEDELDLVVHTSREPAYAEPSSPGETARRVAHEVASIVPDGATLQCGVGALPDAVLAELGDRTDLGIHTGLLSDAAADLMAAGVVTNARKSLDRGRTVAGMLMGSRRVAEFADTNPAITLRETGYTHDPGVLAALDGLVAINTALEVDLTGQTNAEEVGGSYVGAVGGAVDFLRGAARARGGLPVVALPATAGERSRIVARLGGPVTTPRCDAGVVVTEYGVADLRGVPLAERVERMLAIAHPDHRQALAEAAESSGGRS